MPSTSAQLDHHVPARRCLPGNYPRRPDGIAPWLSAFRPMAPRSLRESRAESRISTSRATRLLDLGNATHLRRSPKAAARAARSAQIAAAEPCGAIALLQARIRFFFSRRARACRSGGKQCGGRNARLLQPGSASGAQPVRIDLAWATQSPAQHAFEVIESGSRGSHLRELGGIFPGGSKGASEHV